MRTYLRMTSPDQLRPATPLAALSLRPVDSTSPLFRNVFTSVGRPHHWPFLDADAASWAAAMTAPGLRHWLIVVDAEPVGVAALQAQPAGKVEVTSFGLVPAAQGHGYGGDALTRAVSVAWATDPVDEHPINTVWLHTSSLDHTTALINYQRRGFQPYCTEVRHKDLNG